MDSINIERANGGWLVRYYEYTEVPTMANGNHVFTDIESAIAFVKEKMIQEPKKPAYYGATLGLGQTRVNVPGQIGGSEVKKEA